MIYQDKTVPLETGMMDMLERDGSKYMYNSRRYLLTVNYREIDLKDRQLADEFVYKRSMDKYPDLCQDEVDELLSEYPEIWVLLNKRTLRKKKMLGIYDMSTTDIVRLIHYLREFEASSVFRGVYQIVKAKSKNERNV